MKAEELRIGNLVSRTNKHTKKEMTIELTVSCIFDIYANGENSSFIYKSIPLTEQWLLDFGFTKSLIERENPNEGYYYTKELSDNKYYDLSLMSGDKNGFVEVYLFPYDNIRFKFVHEIQNCFYSLTNKELK